MFGPDTGLTSTGGVTGATAGVGAGDGEGAGAALVGGDKVFIGERSRGGIWLSETFCTGEEK